MEALTAPLNGIQLDLLNLFSAGISTAELRELKLITMVVVIDTNVFYNAFFKGSSDFWI